ncbi:hypothetical protein J3459_007981 [Metarhizium acridum]|nr:hypothetical protein J3459_007981 [Metarhizium acridum]
MSRLDSSWHSGANASADRPDRANGVNCLGDGNKEKHPISAKTFLSAFHIKNSPSPPWGGNLSVLASIWGFRGSRVDNNSICIRRQAHYPPSQSLSICLVERRCH